MSVQLDLYCAHRALGATMHTAAAQAGLGIGEARLTENDIARGDIALPEPDQARAIINRASRIGADEGAGNMAKKAKVGDGPTNISAAKEVIRDAVPRIVNLKEKRKAINAEIAEWREKVNSAGVPKKALDHAIRIREMDPEDRQKFDEGYIIAREAIGVAVQRGLFEMLDEPAGQDVPANDETADAAA